MHEVKRIEIIANSVEQAKILGNLKKSGIRGHVVVHNVTGGGLSEGNEDLDMTMMDNVYIIAFCRLEQLKMVVENIRPLLNKFGGTCHISDAFEVSSMRCVASL